MKSASSIFRFLLLFLALTVVFGCDRSSDSSTIPGGNSPGCGQSQTPSNPPTIPDDTPGTYPNPTVENPPDVGSLSLMGTTMFRLKDYGYEQVEFFYGGTANAYVNTAEMKSDGKWEVEPKDSAPYKSRMVIYRPTDLSKFNGTVVMEWFNVTAAMDTAAEWLMVHSELLRRGYIYVGVTAQAIGIEGGEPPLPTPVDLPMNLKTVRPRRYKSLSHPGDSFSYDIFAQAAQAVRHPKGISPLGDLKIERLIAMGESQSATRLNTFINAFGKKTDLFDGYFVHSRLGMIPDFGGASAPLSQPPQADITTPEVVTFRDDIDKPVMNVQTETDLFVLGAYICRQPDSENFRLWEIPGAAHADLYTMKIGMTAQGQSQEADVLINNKPVIVITCPDPLSSAPQHHFVSEAALSALVKWVQDGTAPPTAPRIEVNAAGDDVEVDQFGNALGGIRNPYMDVPIARLSGKNSRVDDGEDICFLFGETEMLDKATLQSLYSDHNDYVSKVAASAREMVANGFLISEDAETIIKAAEASDVP